MASESAELKAQAILRDDVPWNPEYVLEVAKDLKNESRWGRARSILKHAANVAPVEPRDEAERAIPLLQQLALTYSRDGSLPYRRHQQGLEILEERLNLKGTQDRETLGIAGGILKRMWERSGQTQNLTHALTYYERGMRAKAAAEDYGYNAINVAFLNDKIAGNDDSENANRRRQEARRIRESLVQELPRFQREKGTDWWFLVTVAEAHLGLGHHDEAANWLCQANNYRDGDWMAKGTATQLAELVQLQTDETCAKAGLEVVAESFDGAAVEDLGRRYGLALSGGGFRASLYHIGVLACLADADVLRRVEAISCVSGGSIIGAQYYLELKHELETKEIVKQGMPEIEARQQIKEAYRQVVRRVEKQFVVGVQRNLRTRMLTNLKQSLQILFTKRSRTRYLGELLESEFFARTGEGASAGIYMPDLKIQPMDEHDEFHPENRNWQRRAKVPMLILNATSLNTGHLWQFNASWMGEPPGTIQPEVDRRERLRRMRYEEAPNGHKKIRLGHAVAASACVPGIFEPFDLDDLYPNRKVRLVDGGVFDNHGVEGLRLLDCREVFVSDASGPLIALAEPKGGVLDAPVRSNSIGMKVVRDRRHQGLGRLMTARALKDFKWVHLVQDVQDGATVDWIECERPSETNEPEVRSPTKVQERIAALRTDLDSFSEVECHALMAQGYEVTRRALKRSERGSWGFLDLQAIMQEEPSDRKAQEKLLKLLEVGSTSVFKVWKISRPLQLLALLLFAALVWGFYKGVEVRNTSALVIIGGSAVAIGVLWIVQRLLGWSRFFLNLAAVFGWGLALVHLYIFDWLFLRYGRVSRILSQVKEPASDSVGGDS